ncbi:Methylase/helicase [Sphingomonas paucimobilis]|nr:Methylase/helicase [Sphingomonas paucimobilis]
MTQFLSDATLRAAPSSAASGFAGRASALLAAARILLPALEAGRTIDGVQLRTAMSDAFGGSVAFSGRLRLELLPGEFHRIPSRGSVGSPASDRRQ